jgi:hypothetical protein
MTTMQEGPRAPLGRLRKETWTQLGHILTSAYLVCYLSLNRYVQDTG